MSLTSLRWGRRGGDRPARRRGGERGGARRGRPTLEWLEGRLAPATGLTAAVAATPALVGGLGAPHPAATQDTTTSLVNGATGATVFGQTVPFTVTVAPTAGTGTPTGTVTLTSGSINLGNGTLGANGSVTVDVTTLPVGTDPVIADYVGDADFTASNSSAVNQTVNQAATTVTATADPAQSTEGTPVVLTADLTVTPPGAGTPTGTVQFVSGGQTIGSATVTNGAASVTTSTLPVGQNAVTAEYTGDTNFGTSTSGPITAIVLAKTGTTSKTTLTSSATGATVFGQPVPLTATVAPATGTGTPTGSVAFYSGTTPVGTATLTNGSATIIATTLPVGADSLTAQYTGDSTYAAGTSPALSQTVTQAATTVAVTSSSSATTFGSPVTLTATIAVTSPGAGTPTGTVQFFNGTTSIGSGTVANGVASLATTTLPIGANAITAVYSGDTNFKTSTSPAVTQTVTSVATTTTLTASTQTADAGQAVTLTATVAASSTSGTTGNPTGDVQFLNGTTVIATVPVNSTGVATLSTTTLPGGANSITANYLGDETYSSSTSSATVVTVNLQGTTVALTVSPTPASAVGQTVQLKATVAVTAPGTATPTGTVSFFAGPVLLGTSTLTAGTATLATTALPVGVSTLTAVYSGDALTAASTSAAVAQVVGSGNQLYVNQIYLDLLDRPVDSASLAKWTTRLSDGLSRSAFVAAIDHSREARVVAVQNAYTAYLGRLATTAEVDQTIAAARSFGNDVRVPVLTSAEYVVDRAGGTVDGYLTALTSDVIGSMYPAVENESYSAALIGGEPKTKVVVEVLHSTPAAAATVNTLYNGYLGREPTVSELTRGIGVITSGGSPRRVQDAILASKEYYTRSTSTTGTA